MYEYSGVTQGPVVSTDWLADRLDDPSTRIADVRWYLDPKRSGRAAYESGHIPGAVFFDLDASLAAPGGRLGGPLGRHPWPSASQVESVMGEAGIEASTFVVAYDDQAGAIAARLWYVLRAYGHDGVAVLDGGLVKWLAEGRPMSTQSPKIEARRFVARPADGSTVTKQDVIDSGGDMLLIDARAGERYRGEMEPIDPKAGHIPGAVNVPYALNLTAGEAPVFRPPSELRELYARAGADRSEPVVYCGSGVTSCHSLVALEMAGLRGRLYPGSWSEWCSDPDRPVASGP